MKQKIIVFIFLFCGCHPSSNVKLAYGGQYKVGDCVETETRVFKVKKVGEYSIIATSYFYGTCIDYILSPNNGLIKGKVDCWDSFDNNKCLER